MTSSSPTLAAAALHAARAALQRGDAEAAAAKCREAIERGLDDASTWALLGTALRTRDPAASEDALKRALARDPRFVDAHFHLGNLYREQRRFADAVTAYEKTLSLLPGHASIINNLGQALEGAGRPDRAARCYREVLRAQPRHRQALGNLGHLLCAQREYAEALRCCEEYLRTFPDPDPVVLVDHGICLQFYSHDNVRAEASYRRAAALAPGDTASLLNLGTLLIERNDHDEAVDVLARAVAADLGRLTAPTLLALSRQHLCDWNGLDALHASIAARIEREPPEASLASPFALLSMPMPAATQRRAAEGWCRYWWPALPAAPAPRPVTTAVPSRKLRLGYLSSDFCDHPIAFLLTEVWELHDRTRFETFAYSIGPRSDAPIRRRIESAFDHFADAFDEPPARTAQRIRDDGIDVLIDLNGFTLGARSDIPAMRPAPVQMSWLGYLGTLGASWMDYVITDRYATPADMQLNFTERFLYLPDCYCPSDTRREVAPLAATRGDVGLPATGFVFCCFNNTYKILPAVFDIWMRLLDKTAGSVLWLAPGSASACRNLKNEAAARGINPNRLLFAAHVPPPEHLARLVHADLYLDTAPYNSGTTANDALLMGLPLITASGATMASRVAGSQLHAAGLPELAANDLPGYEALALKLAGDPILVAGYRQRLRENRRSAALFDMPRFTRGLEAALLCVWRGP